MVVEMMGLVKMVGLGFRVLAAALAAALAVSMVMSVVEEVVVLQMEVDKTIRRCCRWDTTRMDHNRFRHLIDKDAFAKRTVRCQNAKWVDPHYLDSR